MTEIKDMVSVCRAELADKADDVRVSESIVRVKSPSRTRCRP